MTPRQGLNRRRLLVLAGAGAALPHAASAAPYTDTDKLVAAMRAYAAGQAPKPSTQGFSSAIVLPNDQVVTAVSGWADPQRRIRMAPATRLMSGSTGKTFCATVAMALVGEGRLSLDAPVSELFRDEPWFARLPNARALTLRMLLNHTQGWPQFLDLAEFQRVYLADAIARRSTAYSPRKMLGFLLDREPLAAPGAAHHYTDLGYHLVGLCIEKVTGRGYYAELQDRVLARLPFKDILPAVRRDLPGLAAGYARGDLISRIAGRNGRTTDARGVLRNDPNLEYTGGGLAVTPRSLALFYRRLGAGEIIAPALVAQMISSSVPVGGAGNTTRYGLGVFVSERPRLGRYISHSGYYPGFNSNVGYFLDHGFAAAMQVNTDHGPDIYGVLRDLAGLALDARA